MSRRSSVDDRRAACHVSGIQRIHGKIADRFPGLFFDLHATVFGGLASRPASSRRSQAAGCQPTRSNPSSRFAQVSIKPWCAAHGAFHLAEQGAENPASTWKKPQQTPEEVTP